MIVTLPVRVLVADPAWAFEDRLAMSAVKRGAEAQYQGTLTGDEVAALPVRELLDEHALGVVWVPSALLSSGLQVLEAWGFTLKQTWTWVKTRKGVAEPEAPEDCAFGMGHIARNAHELALVGTRGKVGELVEDHSVRTVFFAPALPHSRKPECVQDALDRLAPRGPRLELFARRARPGWTCIGNEAPGWEGCDLREMLPELIRLHRRISTRKPNDFKHLATL